MNSNHLMNLKNRTMIFRTEKNYHFQEKLILTVIENDDFSPFQKSSFVERAGNKNEKKKDK